MLYDLWLEVAAQGGHGTALVDGGSGQSWSFRQLRSLADGAARVDDPVRWVNAAGPEFVIEVLRGWRHGQAVCPLEPGQARLAVPPPPRGTALMKTTSATTGTPRCIVFTAEQLAADVSAIVRTMGLDRSLTNLGAISLAHSYGFSNLVLPLLLHSIPLVLAPSTLPEAIRRVAGLGSPWVLPAVPALWRVWHEAGAIPANVRLAISAGAPLPLALERRVFEDCSLKLHNFFGASECGGIAFDADTHPRADAALAGSALADVSLELERDCLAVRSPAVGLGYWPEPDARLRDGVFRTQDLVEIRDGRVYLMGRATDLLNVAGRKLNPQVVEDVLGAHPAVSECLVLGVASAQAERGEEVAAVVVPRRPVAETDLRGFLLERLAAWQVPRRWLLVDSLDVNRRGKSSRAAWRMRLEGG